MFMEEIEEADGERDLFSKARISPRMLQDSLNLNYKFSFFKQRAVPSVDQSARTKRI